MSKPKKDKSKDIVVAGPNDVTSEGPGASAPEVVVHEDEELEAQLAFEYLKRRREAKKRKRIIIIAVVSVVVLVVIAIRIIGSVNDAAANKAEKLVTGTTYQGDFASTVTANGATEPLKSTIVTPEVDGIIEDLQVQEGSYVNEGDVLFTLKNEKLDKDVREAQTKLDQARRNVDKTNREVDNAYASYNDAWNKAAAADDWSAFDEGSLRSAIDSAEASYQDALSAVTTAEEDLSEVQTTADKRTVRAPTSGRIVAMTAKNGTAVGSVTGASASSGNSASSGKLMEIADLSKMQVTVQVNEIDISSVKEGQEATATFSALPDLSLKAVVQRIATESSGAGGEGGSSGGGVVTYAVDLLIPEPDERLKPGMTATVNIVTQSVPNSTIVPSAALMENQNGDGSKSYSVTVLDDPETNETHVVPVTVVAQNSSEVAVKGDVHDGDAVVLGAGGAGGADGDMSLAEEGAA